MSLVSKPVFGFVCLSLLYAAVFVSCASKPEATPEPAPAPVIAAPQEKPVPVEPAPAETPAPQKRDTLAILAEITMLLAQGDFDAGIALFEEIESPDAESAKIQLLKASVMNSARLFNEARAITNAVIAAEPENMDALFVLSMIEKAENKPREQHALLQTILDTDPAHINALNAMGDLYTSGRSFKNAALYYDRALAEEPENGTALVGRALVYRYNHDSTNAERLLNKAVAAHPDWAQAYNERARLHRDENQPLLALADLDIAKELAPNDYWIATDRGSVLIYLHRKPEALEEYERAITIDPDNFLAYVYIAGIKDEFDDYDGAEAAYEILTRLRPDYYFGFEGLGMHKMRKRQWAAARDAFLQAYLYAPEINYALLAAVNWIRESGANGPKAFLEDVLKTLPRESLTWYVVRMFHDLRGDSEVANRIAREKNEDTKAQLLYYLASYYDLSGKPAVADVYFERVRELNRPYMVEWRLNEWALEQRRLALSK
ncbi:MAG: tetratricopeptide repeat protein [Treponema sp.]|jgi:tetratricopeptide (TPR) repeat protein|nr:tetratricopeptide repeat protein [Treponema sp.]